MKTKRFFHLAAAALTGAVLLQAPAALGAPFENNSTNVTLGTLGVGVEAATQLSPGLVLRGGPSYMSFSASDSYSGVDYDSDLEFFNVGMILDWHPMHGGFRVSGGVLIGNNTIDIDSNPLVPVQVGNAVYTPAQTGRMHGEVDMQNIAPYVGIGYSDTFYNQGPWGYSVDAGVRISSTPDVSLTSTGGTLSNTPAFQADLAREQAQIEDDVDWLQFYPVVTVGMSYRF